MPEAHSYLCKKHYLPDSPDRADIGEDTHERIVSAGLFPPLTKRHGILLCGLSEARTGFYFVRARPLMWQALVCLGGKGEVWNAEYGVWEPCESGSAYITPPDAPHAYRALPDGTTWEVAWVILPATSIGTRGHLPRRIDIDGEPLAASIRGLHTETLYMERSDPLVTESWGALVRAYAARLCIAATTGHGALTGDPRLVRLFAEVAANPAYQWDLETLAARVGVSGEHLRRLCRAEGMESPMRRVTELRMRHAAALLSSGFYTVERAAARVGYDNPFAFSTAFKRVLGRSPSAFRPNS